MNTVATTLLQRRVCLLTLRARVDNQLCLALLSSLSFSFRRLLADVHDVLPWLRSVSFLSPPPLYGW